MPDLADLYNHFQNARNTKNWTPLNNGEIDLLHNADQEIKNLQAASPNVTLLNAFEKAADQLKKNNVQDSAAACLLEYVYCLIAEQTIRCLRKKNYDEQTLAKKLGFADIGGDMYLWTLFCWRRDFNANEPLDNELLRCSYAPTLGTEVGESLLRSAISFCCSLCRAYKSSSSDVRGFRPYAQGGAIKGWCEAFYKAAHMDIVVLSLDQSFEEKKLGDDKEKKLGDDLEAREPDVFEALEPEEEPARYAEISTYDEHIPPFAGSPLEWQFEGLSVLSDEQKPNRNVNVQSVAQPVAPPFDFWRLGVELMDKIAQAQNCQTGRK